MSSIPSSPVKEEKEPEVSQSQPIPIPRKGRKKIERGPLCPPVNHPYEDMNILANSLSNNLTDIHQKMIQLRHLLQTLILQKRYMEYSVCQPFAIYEEEKMELFYHVCKIVSNPAIMKFLSNRALIRQMLNWDPVHMSTVYEDTSMSESESEVESESESDFWV